MVGDVIVRGGEWGRRRRGWRGALPARSAAAAAAALRGGGGRRGQQEVSRQEGPLECPA